MTYSKDLHPNLRFFETTIKNSSIHVSKTSPQPRNLSAPAYQKEAIWSKVRSVQRLPQFASRQEPTPRASEMNGAVSESMIASVEGAKLSTMTCKLQLNGMHAKKLTEKDTSVTTLCTSPFQVEVSVGKMAPLTAHYPVPINGHNVRLRIARKSSYIELVAQVCHGSIQHIHPQFISPFSREPVGRSAILAPVNWMMSAVNLSKLPTLDRSQKSKMQWLQNHVSLGFSDRERAIKDSRSAVVSHGTTTDVRLDLKESIFTIFNLFSGIHPEKAQVFGLNRADADGMHILIFASSLRLDLTNRTVIIDAAVVPLTRSLVLDPVNNRFLGALHRAEKIGTTNFSAAELKLWKHILPAFADRCRTWSHDPKRCEYLKIGKIPLSDEEDMDPLCSCGHGYVPDNYMPNLKVTDLGKMLKKHATRVAISTLFPVPWVDDPGPRDLFWQLQVR